MAEDLPPIHENNYAKRDDSSETSKNQPDESHSPLLSDSICDSARHATNSETSDQETKDKPGIWMKTFTGVIAFFAIIQGITTVPNGKLWITR